MLEIQANRKNITIKHGNCYYILSVDGYGNTEDEYLVCPGTWSREPS